ncbi:MAG TPA: CDP-alcohol phosphatidyltransferase family protein [Candidatus Saccharimonadales bacterium]|nr:CDP-alcohol phosphatidyltransferase family protein [Candidatus Saccharimonadales bacterium]
MSEIPEPPKLVQTVIDRLPDGAPRRIVNGLSWLRVGASPPLTAHLLFTQPEERSPLMGAVTAAVASTDKGDGIGADWIGPTERGNKLDKLADRSFVIPQYGALALKGEIPRIHFGLKVARETVMYGLRRWGAPRGKSQMSRPVNRQKTADDMLTLVTAHSPFARHEDLLRWEASMSTALSLTGFFETVVDYAKKDEPEVPLDTARNSKAREVSAGPLSKLAKLIDKKAPGITPSGITRWSKRGVNLSAGLALLNPDKPALATTLFTGFSLGDTVDGALAREKGEDGADGMVEDVKADLEQQIVTLAVLSVIAKRRGNKVAAVNYAIAAMATPLSALTRAQAEGQGYIVAEGGIGTRAGRGILSGMGIAFNKRRDASDIISAALASNTVNTVLERKDVVQKGIDSDHCKGVNDGPGFIEEAKIRERAIRPYAERGLAVGAALLALAET